MTARNWAALRKLLRQTYSYNGEVYRWFKDADTNATRLSLRDECLIQARDSYTDAMTRIKLFRDQVQKTHLRPDVYGIPIPDRDAEVVYKPQVTLNFIQDKDAVPNNYQPITAQISFRLMDETYKTISNSNIKTLANKIKIELATGEGYRWTKGKILCLYQDKEKGYDFQVYAATENEGEQVIKKIISIQNHSFETDFFRHSTPKRNSDNTPSTELILDETRRKPRWRPTGYVRFAWADLAVWNVKEPITLVDLTGLKRNPMERA
jgi:hypothetical protein